MSDFEENFEIPAASEVDPAAEFLAKEQVGEERELLIENFISQFYPVSKLIVLAAVLQRQRPSLKVFVRSVFVFSGGAWRHRGGSGDRTSCQPAGSRAD